MSRTLTAEQMFGAPPAAHPIPTPTPSAPQNLTAGQMFGSPENLTADQMFSAPEKPVGGSALDTIVNAIDVPLEYLDAMASDLVKPGPQGHWYDWVGGAAATNPHTTAIGHLLHDIHTRGLQYSAQHDDFTRAGWTNDRLANPTHYSPTEVAMAHFWKQHPWLAGTADFAHEFANPSNIVAGAAARPLGWALRSIPGVESHIIEPFANTVANTVGAVFNKYRPLERISRTAMLIGRQADSNLARHYQLTNEAALRIFGRGLLGGTRRADRIEIWRRAVPGWEERGAQLGTAPVNGTTQFGRITLSDEGLNNRAAMLRQHLDALDQEQQRIGAVPPARQAAFESMSGRYTPMAHPLTYTLPTAQGVLEEAAHTMPGLSQTARANFRNVSGWQKLYRTPDEAIASGHLSPEFDPHTNFVWHAHRIHNSAAAHDFVQMLVNEEPAAARAFEYKGKTGAEAIELATLDARAAATTHARARAADIVARQFGLSTEEVIQASGMRFTNPARLRGMIATARKLNRSIEPIISTLQNATQRTMADISNADERLIAHVEGYSERGEPVPAGLQRQLDALRTRLVGAASKAGARLGEAPPGARPGIVDRLSALRDRAVAIEALGDRQPTTIEQAVQAFRRHRDDILPGEQSRSLQHIVEQNTPAGFARIGGNNIRGLGALPIGAHTLLQHDAIRYFEQAMQQGGAQPEEIAAMGAWVQRIKALYRMGIVYNPIVHPLYNLMWGYLAKGGNIAHLPGMFRLGETSLDRAAAEAGAHAHITPFEGLLGGSAGSTYAGSLSDAPRKLDWLLSRMTNANRHLVFDIAERNMSTALWDDLRQRLVKQGMDETTAGREAARQVRGAFGDYGNLTQTERHISRAMMFYQWSKAVYPTWLRAMFERPQMIAAPFRGLQTSNALRGDPNALSERMGTVYLGKDAEGTESRLSLPMPQRRLENLLRVLMPVQSASLTGAPAQVNENASPEDRIRPLLNEAVYSLAPGYNTGAATLQELAAPPQEPGVTAASNIMFDRDAPTGVQAEQFGKALAQQTLPFAGSVQNLARAFEAARGGQLNAAPFVGGYVYRELSPMKRLMLDRAFARMQRAYNHAYVVQDPRARALIRTRAYETFEREKQMLQNSARAPVTPTPAAQNLTAGQMFGTP